MEEINRLVAQANKLYALSNFEEAADVYAEASEHLAELHGEDNPQNADVMFLYGRTLVKLALQKSEVLGGAHAEETPAAEAKQPENGATQGRFSFTGDAASDDEGGGGGEDDEKDEGDQENTSAEDDLQNAWEILDLARVSYQRQIDSPKEGSDTKGIEKRLADTYDLLGEVALENENFDQAVSDLQAALKLKTALYDQASSQRSGAHYMLALALEYCTEPASRVEAARQVEEAIASFELRLRDMDPDSPKAKEEVEMLAELRLKLSELQAPPESIPKSDMAEIFGSVGSGLKENLVQAMQSSNDLTSLVRKKEKKRPVEQNQEPEAGESSTSGNSDPKRAKVE